MFRVNCYCIAIDDLSIKYKPGVPLEFCLFIQQTPLRQTNFASQMRETKGWHLKAPKEKAAAATAYLTQKIKHRVTLSPCSPYSS